MVGRLWQTDMITLLSEGHTEDAEQTSSDDERLAEGAGLKLSKAEILAVTVYVQLWQQRQCMCCFRELKNCEKINNIVQVILSKAIWLIQTLPLEKPQLDKDDQSNKTRHSANEKDVHDTPSKPSPNEQDHENSSEKGTVESQDRDEKTANRGDVKQCVVTKNEIEKLKESDICAEKEVKTAECEKTDPRMQDIDDNDKTLKKSLENEKESVQVKPQGEGHKTGSDLPGGATAVGGEEEGQGDAEKLTQIEEVDAGSMGVHGDHTEMEQTQTGNKDICPVVETEIWTLEEKDLVFQLATKVFLLNFPMYVAYKHIVQSPLEELSQQDAAALNNFCELTDPDVPVFLLRNVCFFCDSNGIQAVAQCFDKCNTVSLPYNVAHTLITLIANLRLWMNMVTVMQYIVPLRSHVIGYMCRLSDQDLRLAGTRNMTDLMWAAVKEPMEGHYTFDKEGLTLAFKYFTCSTLTIRLAGITQINNQVQLYNEMVINTDSGLMNKLSDWLIEHEIVEHLFGPNLHAEIIKQSELILTLLAVENRLSMEHVECIWAAGQLKHCGRSVLDILTPLTKNMDARPVQHLLKLVCELDPSQHTEQTLYLASALIKYIWHNASNQTQMSIRSTIARQHQHCHHQALHQDGGHTSSEHSESEEDLEEGEVLIQHKLPSDLLLRQRRCHAKHARVKIPPASSHPAEMTSEEANTDLSNVSDDSLPSDLSEGHVMVAGSRCRGHHHQHGGAGCRHGQHHEEGDGFSEEEEEEDSEGEDLEIGKHVHVMGCKDVESSSSEGSGNEDPLVGNQKTVARRQRVQPLRKKFGRARRVPITKILKKVSMKKPEPKLHESVRTKSEKQVKRGSERDEPSVIPAVCDEKEQNVEKNSKPVIEGTVLGTIRPKGSSEASSKDSSPRGSDHLSPKSSESEKNTSHEQVKENSPEGQAKGIPMHPGQEKGVSPSKGQMKVVSTHQGQRKVVSSIQGQEKVVSPSQGYEKVVKPSAGFQDVQKDEAEPIDSGSDEETPHFGCEDCLHELMDTSGKLGVATEHLHHHHGIEELNSSAEAALLQEMDGRSEMERMCPRIAGKNMTEDELNLYLEHLHDIAQREGHSINSEMIEEILSPEEGGGSCNSSHLSNKSEKNMADFEGEDVLSEEEELAHINHTAAARMMHQRNVRVYRGPHGMVVSSPKRGRSGEMWKCFKFEDVCKPGNTLLWDLIQEPIVRRLPEGLAGEAEKILTQLVCFTNENRIRTGFIQACVQNVANHRSVVISLHLLCKLLGSFQQYREDDLNTHTVTKWAEQELCFMKHFFNDLVFYTNLHHKGVRPQSGLYSHKEEIQVRLQFLTCVFTSAGSTDNFRLTLDQVDMLWNCLASDRECRDELFNWLLNQAKTKEHHALGVEAFKHVFLNKMPTLEPEHMSMTGLNLFTQLCGLARIANSSLEQPLPEEQISGMDQLWGVALKALNTDVSLTAIQFLNSYYINYGSGSLEKEAEFVQRCMDSLMTVSTMLEQHSENGLQMIQRGLILMTNHLESFRKRYAFHLRNWQLEGKGIFSHQKDIKEKQSAVIRIMLQPAGASERTQLEMLSTDLVAELRAEVTRWWENLQRQLNKEKLLLQQAECGAGGTMGGSNTSTASISEGLVGQVGGTKVSAMLTPILGAMLGEGPIRMITGGQELCVDLDDRTLMEVGLKDSQLVFVSLGAHRAARKSEVNTPPSYLNAPSRANIPMMLLLGEPHFHRVLALMQQLSNFRPTGSADQQEQYNLQTRARVLSRKVWDLLMLLPTNPTMLKGFQSIGQKQQESVSEMKWSELLDASSPHKLMYSLQIVEYLSRPPRIRKASIFLSRSDSRPESLESEMTMDEGEIPEEVWSKKFVSNGGLKHLFQIFLSGGLQQRELGTGWDEWHQDCLASLLRLLNQFAVLHDDAAEGQEDVFDNWESPRKKMKKLKGETVMIPRLNGTILLNMVDVDNVVQILLTILKDAAMPPREYVHWPLTSWGRVEVIRYAFSFLVSFGHSCEQVQPVLCTHPMFGPLLKSLTLEAPEPAVRQEACQGLYRLCLGKTSHGHTGYVFLIPVLTCLLAILQSAQHIRPPKKRSQEEKEPYGPACRDYFWIVCRLTDAIKMEDAVATWEGGEGALNLNVLTQTVSECVLSRGFLETRHNTVEDDGLIGLLSLTTSLMKLNPPFKSTSEGQAFLVEIFWCLFTLPTPSKRFLPKCKSDLSRSMAFDLLAEIVKSSAENYSILHSKIISQHSKESHTSYTWDMWPAEEQRSSSGYVGLTNLGATCYMATCMQHLYMIPEARRAILEARISTENKYYSTVAELKKMFAYLLESERKAYNPRSFCKVYTMDHQPLNTGEQKDMTEFFTDLITKMEDMCPELRRLVKRLFGGILTNNVVSLDCPHVSRTKEEFHTVRCQVADMRNLHESLDEVTVKDMLEGDNMYTCSKCQKKVRAEKRACFRKLPQILCFNTMRYTFNMVTMMKEKVNTHFSFPLRLDMAPYTEKHLIKKERLQESSDHSDSEEDSEPQEFELIGVTVHTGTAEGGHYYSFIRDRLSKNELGQDKWFLFNDAEVKAFDAAQIATECFGGEMTSKTYDSVTDKFMDFSFEKTNSAYMLFYERIKPGILREDGVRMGGATATVAMETEESALPRIKIELSKELNDWIWQDNMQFLKDKSIFEHTYFSFLWQMCRYLPHPVAKDDPDTRVQLMNAQLGASFVLETLIHAKEKPTMLQWIELVTKQFNSCHRACEWFLDHMASDDWWPQQILIKCPTQLVRQMFHRLIIHVITQLRPTHGHLYLAADSEEDQDPSNIGNQSCVTRFVRKMLAILNSGSRPHCKYLFEYFVFLYDFAKLGDVECRFLLRVNAIASMVMFFMSHKSQESFVEILSEEEEEDEMVSTSVHEDKYRPQSLERMIALISLLVEKSRDDDNRLGLSDKDLSALIGGKTFPFLFNQIKDCINIRYTCNMIFSLSRWNDRLAIAIIQMIFASISRLGVESQPFFKLLSMLVEFVGGPPGMPPFTHYILQKFWEVAEFCPQQSLEWLSSQVMRNKLAHAWTLQNMEAWVEPFLLAHNNLRVRNAAAYLLVALVPSNPFRQLFRSTRSMVSPCKEKMMMSEEALLVLHEVYGHLLRLLGRAKQYVDNQTHNSTKLVPYFTVLTHCLVSRSEKLMFQRYFSDLWTLFQPKLSEPAIATNNNKQALLHFWHQVCIECPENVKMIVTSPHVAKNIAFNYILADHEDQDVVLFNRSMLPAYYGILRMACQASRAFTRQLAAHQNVQWAFKNITPYPGQYIQAVDELLKMMRLMVARYPDMSEEDEQGVERFKHDTLALYLDHLEARTHWQTLCNVLKILVESADDRMMVLQRSGLGMLHEAFNTIFVMHHEATACHVASDLVDILHIILDMLKPLRNALAERKGAEMKQVASAWKDKADFLQKLLTLLNSYQPPDIRHATFEVLREMVVTFQGESIQCIVPLLVQSHATFQDSNIPVAMGPYFPKRGQRALQHKVNVRPTRPQFQMYLQTTLLECSRGVDEAYDAALLEFYQPYHSLVDLVLRVAVNQQCVSDQVIQLSTMVAYEGVSLHVQLFAKLWYEIYQSDNVDRRYIQILCGTSSLIDYMDAILLDERVSLNMQYIYQFFINFFPKVYQQVLNDQGDTLMENILQSIASNREKIDNMDYSDREANKILNKINGDLRALQLIFSVQRPQEMSQELVHNLAYMNHICRSLQRQRAAVLARQRQEDQERETGDEPVPRKRRKTSSDSESMATGQPEAGRVSQKEATQTTTGKTCEDKSPEENPAEMGNNSAGSENKPPCQNDGIVDDGQKPSTSSATKKSDVKGTDQQEVTSSLFDKDENKVDSQDNSLSNTEVKSTEEKSNLEINTKAAEESSAASAKSKQTGSEVASEDDKPAQSEDGKPSSSKDAECGDTSVSSSDVTCEKTAVGTSKSSHDGKTHGVAGSVVGGDTDAKDSESRKSSAADRFPSSDKGKKGVGSKSGKMAVRERPGILEMVIRNIESVFSLLSPK